MMTVDDLDIYAMQNEAEKLFADNENTSSIERLHMSLNEHAIQCSQKTWTAKIKQNDKIDMMSNAELQRELRITKYRASVMHKAISKIVKTCKKPLQNILHTLEWIEQEDIDLEINENLMPIDKLWKSITDIQNTLKVEHNNVHEAMNTKTVTILQKQRSQS
jgi:hypothetical protein